MNKKELILSAQSLTVLHNITNTEIFKLTYEMIESLEKQVFDFCKSYALYCSYLLEHKLASKVFYEELLYDENRFAKYSVTHTFQEIPQWIREGVSFDLEVIKKLCSLNAQELLNEAAKCFQKEEAFLLKLTRFPDSPIFPIENEKELFEIYHKNGYGFFSRGKAFMVENGEPVCIEKPDNTRLTDLKGYTRQKKAILANTTAFLKGKQANNILLYGDKGTGKSSTVKAVVNEYAPQGLKIIELKLNSISEFPKICELAGRSPFHFIIFLDDLSFNQEDSNFAILKAFIEGGIAGKPENILIYATSNRRHLVREGLSERSQGDDVHLRDTLETVTSLSDRFGLEITFSVPDKDEYLDIVSILAEEYGLCLEEKELNILAERFAIHRGGRSPRTARQFINHQISLLMLEEKL